MRTKEEIYLPQVFEIIIVLIIRRYNQNIYH